MALEEAPADDDGDPLVGRAVGKYEVRRLIGSGGMGRVYEAWNPAIGKHVALKVVAEDVAASPGAEARFQREARAASAARSPHIVEIYDAGRTDDGRPYIVMELLHGEPLSSALKEHQRLPSAEVVRIATQVLRGLERAHEADIVHRDLKPDNVFLVDHDPDPPIAKILDFGVSKVSHGSADATLTLEGAILGTAAYMSPEQAQGEADVDAQSDIWSVGAIMYQCLTGRQPFTGSSYEQVIVRICTTDAVTLQTLAPDCPDDLAAVVTRCLRRERTQRFGSASEVLRALGQASAGPSRRRAAPARARDNTTVGGASSLSSDTPVGAAAPSARRSSVLIGTLVAAAVLIVSTVTFFSSRTPGGPAVASTPQATSRAAPAASDEPATTIASEASPRPDDAPLAPPLPPSGAALELSSGRTAHPRMVRPPQRSAEPPLASATSGAPAGPEAVAPAPAPSGKGVAGGLVIQHE